jgi:hypothetical protein
MASSIDGVTGGTLALGGTVLVEYTHDNAVDSHLRQATVCVLAIDKLNARTGKGEGGGVAAELPDPLRATDRRRIGGGWPPPAERDLTVCAVDHRA